MLIECARCCDHFLGERKTALRIGWRWRWLDPVSYADIWDCPACKEARP